jgi:hypothetical protein
MLNCSLQEELEVKVDSLWTEPWENLMKAVMGDWVLVLTRDDQEKS